MCCKIKIWVRSKKREGYGLGDMFFYLSCTSHAYKQNDEGFISPLHSSIATRIKLNSLSKEGIPQGTSLNLFPKAALPWGIY